MTTLHPSLTNEYPLGTLFWAIHHAVICEPLTEPLANRIEYIQTQKPEHERETRLAAIRPVLHPEKLPTGFCDALAASVRALADYDQNLISAKLAAATHLAYFHAHDACLPDLLKQWAEEYPDHPAWDEKTGLVFPKP
jgi:hypothetical protein